MENKNVQEFLNWAETEIGIKHAGDPERQALSMRILKEIISYKENHPDFNISDILNEFTQIFIGNTLSPVFNTEADWKLCEGDDLYRHRRHQSLYKNDEEKIMNVDRFIVRDISNPENPETREPCEMEEVLLNKIRPIEFPYFQQRVGILYTMRVGNYVWFVKYLNECTGEFHSINTCYDISEELWMEVPLSTCIKIFMNSVYGKKDEK